MAVVRNTKRTFRSGGNDLNSVLEDYKAFVEKIRQHAEEKVEEAVSTISNKTNTEYSSLPPISNEFGLIDQSSQLPGNPIYYKMYGGKSIITGAAIAKPMKEFIYLEFGTRRDATDSIKIDGGFKSGINTSAVAAPYKSNNPRFLNRKFSGGNYIFLSNIDLEGVKFLKNFWK